MARYGDRNGVAEWLAGQLFDLLAEVRFCAVFPLPSYSLKVVEQYVGYKRVLAEYGGEWSIAQYLNASTETDRQQALERIADYNREDLEATWTVFDWLSRQRLSAPVFQKSPRVAEPIIRSTDASSVRQAARSDQLRSQISTRSIWGTNSVVGTAQTGLIGWLPCWPTRRWI